MPLTLAWGRGVYDETGTNGHYCGGIFMASSVANSTRVWNASIDLDSALPSSRSEGLTSSSSSSSSSSNLSPRAVVGDGSVVGRLGDLEHLRGALGKGVTLDAGQLVWMTDRTPHESMPLKAGTYRQYFRLVTSEISVWYKEHNTPNPLGVLPGDPGKFHSHYRLKREALPSLIVAGDKFGRGKKQTQAKGTPCCQGIAPDVEEGSERCAGREGKRQVPSGGMGAVRDIIQKLSPF